MNAERLLGKITAIIQVRSKEDVNWDRDLGIRDGTGGSHLKAALMVCCGS